MIFRSQAGLECIAGSGPLPRRRHGGRRLWWQTHSTAAPPCRTASLWRCAAGMATSPWPTLCRWGIDAVPSLRNVQSLRFRSVCGCRASPLEVPSVEAEQSVHASGDGLPARLQRWRSSVEDREQARQLYAVAFEHQYLSIGRRVMRALAAEAQGRRSARRAAGAVPLSLQIGSSNRA